LIPIHLIFLVLLLNWFFFLISLFNQKIKFIFYFNFVHHSFNYFLYPFV
jgi:hypothetical protein